jgi:hypothetical protein
MAKRRPARPGRYRPGSACQSALSPSDRGPAPRPLRRRIAGDHARSHRGLSRHGRAGARVMRTTCPHGRGDRVTRRVRPRLRENRPANPFARPQSQSGSWLTGFVERARARTGGGTCPLARSIKAIKRGRQPAARPTRRSRDSASVPQVLPSICGAAQHRNQVSYQPWDVLAIRDATNREIVTSTHDRRRATEQAAAPRGAGRARTGAWLRVAGSLGLGVRLVQIGEVHLELEQD